jgi:hypothetical protein
MSFDRPSMSEDINPRKSLHETILAAYEAEYTELADTWKTIEDKAQGTVTIAGIFIAGALGFIRELPSSTPEYERWFLAATSILLIASVITCIVALRVQAVAAPPLGEDIEALATDLLALEDDSEIAERTPRFLGDVTRKWRSGNDAMDIRNEEKANLVWAAQILLAAAVVLTGIVVFVRVVPL